MSSRSSNALSVPLEKTDEQINLQIDHAPCEDEHQRCSHPSLIEISWKADAVEPRTGIKFPAILDAGDSNFSPPSKEVNILLDVGIC